MKPSGPCVPADSCRPRHRWHRELFVGRQERRDAQSAPIRSRPRHLPARQDRHRHEPELSATRRDESPQLVTTFKRPIAGSFIDQRGPRDRLSPCRTISNRSRTASTSTGEHRRGGWSSSPGRRCRPDTSKPTGASRERDPSRTPTLTYGGSATNKDSACSSWTAPSPTSQPTSQTRRKLAVVDKPLNDPLRAAARCRGGLRHGRDHRAIRSVGGSSPRPSRRRGFLLG